MSNRLQQIVSPNAGSRG